tara:strand:- start:74 stop:334 length:261 start_codon:yes stop_codon:yes gene_type:complete
MSMLDRSIQKFDSKGKLVSESFRNVEWDEVRKERNRLLSISDWRFMSDQTPSQNWTDFRIFLRDLPQNFTEANNAADALNEYNMPE